MREAPPHRPARSAPGYEQEQDPANRHPHQQQPNGNLTGIRTPSAGVAGAVAGKPFLDPQQLVVLGGAIRSGRGAGLDLAATE